VDVNSFDEQLDGATPLIPEEVEGLKSSWISTQGELNQAEAENILRARSWASRTRRPPFWYEPTTSTSNRSLGEEQISPVRPTVGRTTWRPSGKLTVAPISPR
jgi:hypothetical protein